MRPTLYLIMGPSGAGKSMFGHLCVPPSLSILDGDKEALRIKREFGCDINTAYEYASNYIEREINKALKAKESLAVETPFANRVGRIIIERCLELSYQIKGAFLGLNNLEQSIARIKQRMNRGGNVVTSGDAEINFIHSYRNISLYKDSFDEISFFSSDKDKNILIQEAVYKNGELELINTQSTPDWVNQIRKSFGQTTGKIENPVLSISDVLDKIRQNHFTMNELPLNDFQKLNIDIKKLSQDDIEKLLKGEKTGFHQCRINKGGKQILLDVRFSLQRNHDHSVSLLCDLKKEQSKEKNIEKEGFKR